MESIKKEWFRYLIHYSNKLNLNMSDVISIYRNRKLPFILKYVGIQDLFKYRCNFIIMDYYQFERFYVVSNCELVKCIEQTDKYNLNRK